MWFSGNYKRTQNLRQPFFGSALVNAPMIRGPVEEARVAKMLIMTCATILLVRRSVVEMFSSVQHLLGLHFLGKISLGIA